MNQTQAFDFQPAINYLIDRRREKLKEHPDHDRWMSQDPVLQFLTPVLWWQNRYTLTKGPRQQAPGYQSYLRNTLWFAQLRRELSNIIEMTDKARISVIVLKGVLLAETLYGNPGLRAIGDLDLLVRFEDLDPMIELLQGLGWQPRPYQDDRATINITERSTLAAEWQPGEWCFIHPKGYIIDLHWHLIPAPWLRKSYNISMKTIWQSAIPVVLPEFPQVLELTPVHTVIYLCLHLAQHGLQSLKHLLDIDLFVRKYCYAETWSWSELYACVKQWKLQSAVFHVFYFCQSLFGTPFPEDVLETLDPGFFAKVRLRLFLQPDALLDPSLPSIGKKYPALVKLILFDHTLTLLELVNRVAFPTAAWRKFRYGNQTRLWQHWRHVWDVIVRGD